MILSQNPTAEFRGPGMRHNFEDSGDDYDIDMDSRTRGIGGRSGRIILLGDGTEVLTDSDETEMFDQEEEDKDLDSQVSKGKPQQNDEGRNAREETPGPEPQATTEKNQIQSDESSSKTSTLLGNAADISTPKGKPIPESAIPEKLVTPPTSEEKK